MLPLSDHADYDELLRTAQESGATRIYTVHGPESFAGRLRALGLAAEHLGAHPQTLRDDDGGDATAVSDSIERDQHSLDLR